MTVSVSTVSVSPVSVSTVSVSSVSVSTVVSVRSVSVSTVRVKSKVWDRQLIGQSHALRFMVIVMDYSICDPIL